MTTSAVKAVAAAPPSQAQPIRQNRMTMSTISKGKQKAPLCILVHGADGVGKSTFAAGAPSPVFLGTEDGTAQLDVARFPSPSCWEDVLDAVRTLTETESPYRTLVLDSLDWAEPLLWRHVCEGAKAKSIEAVGGGFGKGYTAAVDGWRVLLAAFERLRKARSMNIVLIGHSAVRTFKNPEGEDYDRYVLKLNEKAAGVMREWVSGVYFARHETFAVKDEGARHHRGVTTGSRLLHTQHSAAYDAKDRYGLPEVLPLSWSEFAAAIERGQPGDPTVLREEVARKAHLLGPELEKATLESLARVGSDASKLSQLNDWLNFKVAEKAEKENA